MRVLILAGLLMSGAVSAQAVEKGGAIDEVVASYKAEGASNFSADAGKKMWAQVIPFDDKGEMRTDRSCSVCHHTDIKESGKHKKTGKVIAPMALSAPFVLVEEDDEPRFSTSKKIEKWFKRNCKWTYGRECTAQEKGDFMAFFKSQ